MQKNSLLEDVEAAEAKRRSEEWSAGLFFLLGSIILMGRAWIASDMITGWGSLMFLIGSVITIMKEKKGK